MIVGAKALDEFLRKETDAALVRLIVSNPHLRHHTVSPIQLDVNILEVFPARFRKLSGSSLSQLPAA